MGLSEQLEALLHHHANAHSLVQALTVAAGTAVCCSVQHQAENQRRRDARATRERQQVAKTASAAVSGQWDVVFAAGSKYLTPTLLRNDGCAPAAHYPAPKAPPSVYIAPETGPLSKPSMHTRTVAREQPQRAADPKPQAETTDTKIHFARPEPEPEAEPYSSKAQVAGHPDGIRFEGKTMLKRLQGTSKHDSNSSLAARRDAMPSRGDKEAKFLLHTAPAHRFLRDRVPLAHEIRIDQDGSRWIVMDNLTAGFTSPAILDIKMGIYTYGPAGAYTFDLLLNPIVQHSGLEKL
jgi:hypothetical protein